jgi:hypothetical protein
MDIVYSRVGRGKSDYKGSAIQFIENLGNKKFKEYGVIPIVEDSPAFIKNILFRDLDKDGDIDVYLASMEQNIDGAVIINNGDFSFSLIMPPKAYGLYKKLYKSGVVLSKKFLTSRAKIKKAEASIKFESSKAEASIKFESSIKKNGKVVFEGADKFTKFDVAVPLPNSGASLVGFKDFKAPRNNKLNVRTHIKYGNIDFATWICFEYHSKFRGMAARTNFGKKDWGGLKKIMPSSLIGCKGSWELNDNKSKIIELGIYPVMTDIQENAFAILKALDDNSTIDLSKIRSLQNK